MRARLRTIIDAIGLAFCKLARIQFDAPWRPAPPCS